jgi:hypothetical protein
MSNYIDAMLPILVKYYAQCNYRLGSSLGPAMFSMGAGKVTSMWSERYISRIQRLQKCPHLTSYSRLLSQSSQVANSAIIRLICIAYERSP